MHLYCSNSFKGEDRNVLYIILLSRLPSILCLLFITLRFAVLLILEVRRKWLLPTNGNQEVLLVYESHFYMQLIKFSCLLQSFLLQPVKGLHRRKMSRHALEKMTRDLFRAMSLAPSQKCPGNVVEMKGAMAAFFGSDSVAISCHCKRSKMILVKVLT